MPFICFPVPGWSLAIIIPCTISGCCCCYVRCVEEAEKEHKKQMYREEHVWKSPCVIEMTK